MNNRTRKISCFGTGALLAMLAGAPPALADDTELMLMLPDVDMVKPNILFMLDTSGSMDEVVRTKRPYDPNHPYSEGSCDIDAVYWTEVDVTPSCDSTQKISDTAFKCDAASRQLMGIGSYTDTMVQRRETEDSTARRWQELEAGNSADAVECMADSGVHGGGDTGEVYATNDADISSGFTSDATRELAWGSTPATVTYTVYDGNYLNWKTTAQEEDVRKIEVLQAVTKAVLNSISNVNVGIMRFNNNDGGVVIQAMSDLDTHRDPILQTVDSLTPQGNTPLAEVMYEGALYWRGQAPHFGQESDVGLGVISAGGTYIAPETQVCSKNFNIMLSDGQPVDGNGDQTQSLATDGSLPGFAGADCGAGIAACMDDVAEYLFTTDIDGDAANNDQLVTTHTIGFAIDVQNLQETADDAGGRYFRADDVETLTSALLNIFSDITKRTLSFTAPAIAVNSFNRTQNLNDLYISVFAAEPKVHWPGNLKKYKVAEVNGELQIVDATNTPAVNPTSGFFKDGENAAQSFWTDTGPDGANVKAGGAAHELPLPSARTLLSNTGTGDTLQPVTTANLTQAGLDLGLTGAAGEPTLDELVQWMHGTDIRNEDLDESSTDPRNVMGDPLHSQPAAVVYGGSAASPEVVVYMGTNDGYLHAIDGETGQELWAFIPKELLGDMNRLFFNPNSNFKHYGIDGSIVPVVFDRNNNGIIEPSDGDFVYLVFGMRRGGSSYYALDVSDKSNPVLKWVQDGGFGQTWSTPVIARVDTDDSDLAGNVRTRDAVVIVGGGYDPVHDTPAAPSSPDVMGTGIHMLDLETGERVWRAGPDDAAELTLDTMTRAFPSQVRAVDISGDGFADRMYAADVGGRIWRFDIFNGKRPEDLVEGGIIADLGAGASESPSAVPRRFYNAPDVAIFNDPVQGRRFISISIGSGYRAHPLNEEANDVFFSIRDPDVFNQLGETAYGNYDTVTIDDLQEAELDDPATIGPDDDGWFFQLPAEQAVLAGSTTFNDNVLFVAFTPEVNTTNPCLPTAGKNFLYQVGVVNGNFAVNNLDSAIDEDDTDDNVTEIAQGGIASTATVLFPGSTDPDCEGPECREPPIFCVGAECFDSGFPNNPVRTLWTQDGIH